MLVHTAAAVNNGKLMSIICSVYSIGLVSDVGKQCSANRLSHPLVGQQWLIVVSIVQANGFLTILTSLTCYAFMFKMEAMT